MIKPEDLINTEYSTVKQGSVTGDLRTVGFDKIKEIILKSEKEEHERGFRFCKNDEIKITETCIGEECEVTLKHCPEESHNIGSFHTHPNADKGKFNFLSDDDIYTDLCDKSEFTCLGTVEHKTPRIKCYLPNYGVEKSTVDNRNNLRTELGTKIKGYKSGGPLLKIDEYINTWREFLQADKILKKEAMDAAIRLRNSPNEGADIIIDL